VILQKNGWLNLPSERLLFLYKSAIKQKPGIIPDMMAWMRKEALRQNIQKCGFYGGIFLAIHIVSFGHLMPLEFLHSDDSI
jgi:hypothetical protein